MGSNYWGTVTHFRMPTQAIQEVEALADRVILISEGRVRFDGTPAELRQDGRGLDDRFHELTRSA